MKKLIKSALVVALGAAVLGMMSCQKDNDEHKILEQSGIGASAKWTVNYTNDSASTYNRGFNVLSTKHTSGKCTITIADSGDAISGVIGFVFGKTDNADGTANFGLVGVQRNSSTSLRYYISWYSNIDLSKMDGYENFIGLDGKKPADSGATAKEQGLTQWQNFTNYGSAGSDVTLIVEVEATGTVDSNGVVKAAGHDGGYKITLRRSDGTAILEDNTSLTNTITKMKPDEGTAKQAAIGAYANVYPGKTMRAKVQMTDVVQELAEEE
ncbi:hypothetical protein [Treponema sp.]|uniref:hypothetical protein n=1 Tax=Treponema sp. TaxID=166 RepID=UPI003890A7D0